MERKPLRVLEGPGPFRQAVTENSYDVITVFLKEGTINAMVKAMQGFFDKMEEL